MTNEKFKVLTEQASKILLEKGKFDSKVDKVLDLVAEEDQQCNDRQMDVIWDMIIDAE